MWESWKKRFTTLSNNPMQETSNNVEDVQIDEPNPLISNKPTPLPKLQLFIVFLIQFSEPIAGLVIYPFINQFVQETGITKGDERKTGYYAGIIVRFRYIHIYLYSYHFLFRNLYFSLQNAPRLCYGLIYRIDLVGGLSCFLVHLV